MFKGRVVTGLDIGATSIKIAQLERKPQGLKAVNLICVEVDSSTSIVEKLRGILKDIRVDTLISAIPRHLATVRYLTLPSKDEGEIREMIGFEAERYLPFPLDEVELDFQVIGTNPEGDSEILLVAVRKDAIEHHLDPIHQVGLEPEILDLSSLALFNSFLFSEDFKGKGVTALIDIGRETSEINIMRDGMLRFTRSAALGGKDLNKATQEELIRRWSNHLVAEIRRSIAAYKTEPYGAEIDKLLLSGGGANLKNLDRLLEEQLGVEVQILNPLQRIEVEDPSLKEPSIASRLAIAVGLALRGNVESRMEVNLLPSEVRREKEERRKRRRLVHCGFGIALVIVLGLGLLLGEFRSDRANLRSLDESLESLSKLELEEIKGKIRVIKDYSWDGGSSLELLRMLSMVSPPNLNLTKLDFKKNESLELTGETDSRLTAAYLTSILRKSEYLDKVELLHADKKGNLVEFGIYCKLKGEEE